MAHSTGCPHDSTSANRATGSDTHAGRVIGPTGEFSQDHWLVPVHGLTPADTEGTVKAIAHRDGTVSLHSTCGQSRTTVRFDACRAAQLSTAPATRRIGRSVRLAPTPQHSALAP